MDIYGLIGKNLEHSFSPDYFNKKFRRLKIDAEYKIFELDTIEEFPNLIATNPEIKGLNVTIPYKRAMWQFVNFLDEPVNITGSTNTINIIRKNNEVYLCAYNTDVIGFEKTIKKILKKRKNINALIIGTGGSANSVAYVLRKLGINFSFVTRYPSKLMHTHYSWIDKEKIMENLLIINTTPIGMYPNVNDYPEIPYEYITADHIMYDLVYNPIETMFIKNGKKQAATCINGIQMLEIQAEASWDIWSKRVNTN